MPTLMSKAELLLPPVIKIRQHLLTAFHRYWAKGGQSLLGLPVQVVANPAYILPLSLVSIPLPDWANDCGVNGAILVPLEAVPAGSDWEKVDWWLAAFLMLEGWHERLWEKQHGPIHSYSHRLKGWDKRAWQNAWVNRIALFLRIWAARNANAHPDHLFGSLPPPDFLVTHDVDAITKTLPIRIKQGSFNLFNAFNALMSGDLNLVKSKTSKALHFLFSQEDWWTLDGLLDIEKKHKLSARYHFFADNRTKSIVRWLFDPSYDMSDIQICAFIQRLKATSTEIGLHPSFDSWQNVSRIQEQKNNLEVKTNIWCYSARQHWLRFSWQNTWATQETAGILEDTTLMFNDRPGFRNSAAINWRPWQPSQTSAGKLKALPTLFMDSHFYDYLSLTDDGRRHEMRRWIQECREVNGQGAVLWHPHTLTKDYGWAQGFDELTSLITSV